MLTAYIRAAMRQARYEIIEDDASFYGAIPEIAGVWANAKTLGACREELESVLEGWLLFERWSSSPACAPSALSRQAGIERDEWESL